MCKKYPGLRCGNPVHERVESLVSKLEEAKAFSESLDPSVVRNREITKASRQVTILEGRLKEAQTKYDSTREGFAALEAALQDSNLSSAERTALKVRLKDAAKERAEREKVVSDSEARRANVMRFLEVVGVPANERIEFNDTNIYMPAGGSAKHYEQIRVNRMKAYQERLASYNKALAKANTPAEIAKVEEVEGLAVAKAKSDHNRALYVVDATASGIDALKAKVAKASVCYTTDDEKRLSNLMLRLANANKAHRQNLDSRNYRNAKLAQLKAVVSAHGGDLVVADAVEAFKNKSPIPKTAKRRVPVENMRSSKVYSHLTERDIAAVESAFKQSDEFKSGGEAARSLFIQRRVLTPPHELSVRESLGAVDARTVLGSNGKVGRNHTVLDTEQGVGIPRNQMMGICLTKDEADAIKGQATFLRTSKSALLRDKLLGQSPVAHENDRSARAQYKKRLAVREMIVNGGIAA